MIEINYIPLGQALLCNSLQRDSEAEDRVRRRLELGGGGCESREEKNTRRLRGGSV